MEHWKLPKKISEDAEFRAYYDDDDDDDSELIVKTISSLQESGEIDLTGDEEDSEKYHGTEATVSADRVQLDGKEEIFSKVKKQRMQFSEGNGSSKSVDKCKKGCNGSQPNLDQKSQGN